MTIEYRDASGGKERIIMTVCPVCGTRFTEGKCGRVNHFVHDHTPEDFGLSPLAD